MSSKNRQNGPNVVTMIVGLVGLGWLSLASRPFLHDPDYFLVPYIVWFATGPVAIDLLGTIGKYGLRFAKQLRVLKAKGNKGTARWAIEAEIRRSSNRKKGLYAGVSHGRGVFLPFETSAMVLAGSGAGKTVSTVVPELMNNRMGMLVTDLKGSLACITARHRRKKFGHRTLFLNPGELFASILGKSARFNPLITLIKDWVDPTRHKHLMSDARKLAGQLLPEPVNSGENTFFRNGSRKLLVFAMIYLVTQFGKVTLSEMLSLLSDVERLETALYTAKASSALEGDLACLAGDILGKLDEGDRRQFESFREGALQVLEPFSPSGVLAHATEESDFDFEQLKTGKLTVYLICDPTQQDTFASWIGLVSQAAITELVRSESRKPVLLLLDEATNFKIEALPKLLTSVREFGIRILVVLQELEQWAHVYGRESLDTLLSQTELKIIHSTHSQKSRELISRMLGTASLREESYNTGLNKFSQITRSVSEVGKPLLTPEQVGAFEKSIVFYRNKPPMQLETVGYHQIVPWRSQAQANPYFGKKKYKRRVKLRL